MGRTRSQKEASSGRHRSVRRSVKERSGWASHSQHIWLALFLSLLAVLPYLNALQADFTLDDVKVIRDNPMVTGDGSPLRVLTWVDREIYRPLTMLTYVANARVGKTPFGYHLINVGLHALVTVAMFHLGWMVLGSRLGGTVAAALFATHPIHTEAVTNVIGRAELLAALLVLISLLALVGASRDGPGVGRLWFAVSLAAFAGALLAKESAVAAIALCAIVVYGWCGQPRGLRQVGMVLSPYLGIVLAYLGLRWHLVGSLTMPTPPSFLDNPLAHVSALPRLRTALVVLWEYLVQLALPIRLSADYSFNQIPLVTSMLDPGWLLAMNTFAALAVGLWLSLRQARVLVLAAAFAFVPLSLTSNILFTIGTIKAERLLYLPSVGWCLACGWLVVWVARRQYGLAVLLMALVVTAYSARTWVRNFDWQDNPTLHQATVNTSPGSSKAHSNWGTELIRQKRLDEAIHHLRTAVAIMPDNAVAHGNLGLALAIKGRLAEATLHYREAARIEPANPFALYNLGRILELQGRVDDAAQQLAEAVRVNPSYADAQYLVGTLLLRQGKLDEAIQHFAATVQIRPDHADAHNSWGVALDRQGKIEEAIHRYREALRLKPDHAAAQENLRRALTRRNAARGQ